MKRFALYAGLVVAAHISTVGWHLLLVSKIHPGMLTPPIGRFTFMTGLLPATAFVLLCTRFRRIGGVLLAIALGIGLGIGTYEHFLGTGPNNVFLVGSRPYTAAFRASCVLLLILEIIGCAIGIQAARSRPLQTA